MTKDEILAELLKKRTCHKCGKTWTLEEYGTQFYCRKCNSEYQKKYQKKRGKTMKRLALGVALLALVGCGGSGGSSSGGNHDPLKAVCQACTYGNECESGRCVRFTSGVWRCVPHDAGPGYRCPSGMYKEMGDSCE